MSFWDFPVKYKFSHNFIRDPKKKIISWGFGDAFDRICSVESIPMLWLQKEHTQVHLREIINTSMSYKTLTTSHALSFLATWWPVINRSNLMWHQFLTFLQWPQIFLYWFIYLVRGKTLDRLIECLRRCSFHQILNREPKTI